MKTTLLFVLMLFVFASCGENKPTGDKPVDNSTTQNSTANPTETGTETTTTTTTTTSDSKITDAVVDQVCACIASSKNEDGSMSVDKMRACMGGNMIEFVAKLLGPDATDKQKSDAEQELTKKMGEKCS